MNVITSTIENKLTFFGIDEDYLTHCIEQLDPSKKITLTYTVDFPTLTVTLSGRGKDRSQCKEIIEKYTDKLLQNLKKYLIAEGDETLPERIGRVLIKKEATLSVAESCTGGLVCHHITDVPGSSAYFLQGSIVYSNKAKAQILHVSEHTLENYGAVSSKAVLEMASGMRQIAGTDYAISISGIAGPGGATPTKPVGTVFIGLATPTGNSYRHILASDLERSSVKKFSAFCAMSLLLWELEGRTPRQFFLEAKSQ